MATLLGMVFAFAGLILPSAQAAPAAAPATADPAELVINSAVGVQHYRFPVAVPAGGSLRPADPTETAKKITGEVVVVDAKGHVVGGYDSAVALDSAGKLQPTFYSIASTTLVQTVSFSTQTVFPVAIDPAYTKAGRQPLSPPPPGAFGTAGYVGVPSNYIYNPSMQPTALHDYCTKSPDEFPNPFGANANFRGPCARHDLCYGGGVTSKFTCDNRLLADMRSNCAYTYAWYNPVRGTCYDTASIYWAVVVVAN